MVNLFRRGLRTHNELERALGLNPLETDALLKRHNVSGQALTHKEVAADSGGDVRKKRARVPSRIFAIGPESEVQLLEETLSAWQSQAPAAAWQAVFDLLRLWFEARGLDPETQAVDRTLNQVHRVP